MPCCDASTPYKPEQIHLSLTNNPSEMVVSWISLEPASSPNVEFGLAGQPFTTTAAATISTYTVAGWVSLL
jgi:hypothetical protein